ncbi:capsule assembly Wzi family protein [Granulicella sp. S190]|uniref:capsule assembly Wzi family protein n=1 Tax=Granulicella sp. S190 TaxID=1747226 RepID=UPI0020B14491|nr:capsule assembly Wzi family protein [Granulicella sp. S190]
MVPPAQTTPEKPYIGYAGYAPEDQKIPTDELGSTYIPVDSWVYPALSRLYSMGFVNTMFLGMRPYSRRAVLHMLEASQSDIVNSDNEEAQDILAKLFAELSAEDPGIYSRALVYGLDSSYTRLLGIDGPVLRDSFHLGQTINNDYGRPYQSGFNSIAGASTTNEWGPFSLYVRGEYQHAPSAVGYSDSLASQLNFIDEINYSGPQDTLPAGQIVAQNPFRLVEAYASVHVLGHEISGGKSDAWLGPATGSSLAWSNNAENTYSFRINRVEPLSIPFVSKVLGPVRYDFFVGPLSGHTVPRSPWIHAEMFSFRPTENFEFGFERTIIWGGNGHEPVTLHTFFHGFFDPNDTNPGEKNSPNDPGARFSDFSASYRLPLLRRYVTFYADTISHDDVTPISAPRRASFRTGLYLSQIPRLRKLDFRVEAVSTDPGVGAASRGQFAYWEVVQVQGYTNKGFILGDWIGREAKGGQAWLTYHISGNEWLQLEYLNKKTPANFIPGGTTQNQFKASVVKRLGRDVELNAWVQYEGWKAPIYKPGLQKNTSIAAQFTWYPKLRSYPQH